MFGRKAFRGFALVVFIGLFFSALWYFDVLQSAQDTYDLVFGKEKIVLVSDVKNKKFTFTSQLTRNKINKLAEDWGIWKPGAIVDPKTNLPQNTISSIVVHLVDKPQPFDKFIGKENMEVSSLNLTIRPDRKRADLYLYINPDIFVSYNEAQISKIVTRSLFTSLYFISHVPINPNDDSFIQFQEYIKEFNTEIDGFVRVGNASLIPQAYAQFSQSCGGSANWGGWEGGSYCGGAGGLPCNLDEDCINQTCDYTTTCNITGSGSCGWDPGTNVCRPTGFGGCSTQNNCYTIPSCPSGQVHCGGCINGCRANTQSCNAWIAAECSGGGGGPPAGWGGCGSCASCGGPSNECVTDPNGACLWDPGSCANPPAVCNPSCNPACGQNDGCGGTCGNNAAGAPGVPSITDPSFGEDFFTDDQNNAVITWTAQNKADSYQIEAWKSFSPQGIDLTSVPGAIYSAGTTSVNTIHRAFDTSTTTYWTSTETGAAVNGTSYIGQDFGSTPSAYRQIQTVRIQQSTNAVYRVSSVLVQYSDDMTNWTTAATLSLAADGVSNEYTVPDSGAHRGWRILANSGVTGTNVWRVHDVQMMIAGVATTSQLFTSNTTSYNLVASSREYTIRVRALNSTCSQQYSHWSPLMSFYVVSPISGTVFLDSNSTATLTGNLCTGPTTPVDATGGDQSTTAGAVSGGDVNTTTGRRTNAFDNVNTSFWGSQQRGTNVSGNAWIGQDFGAGNEKHIRKIYIRQYTNNAYNINSIRVEYSDDGSSWTTHQTISIAKNALLNNYAVDSSSPHRYWRIRANQNLTSTYFWAVRELEFHELSGSDVGTLTVSGQDWQNFSESSTVDQSGAYSVHLPYSTTGTNTVSLNITNGQFICSCPVGCVYGGLTSPLTGVNFYVTDAQHPWFQVQGGAVMAHQPAGTAIKNPIPTLCTQQNGCDPYMITRSGGANTSGFILTGGGEVDLRFEGGVQTDIIDEDQQNRVARVTNRTAQERYEYFARLYKFPATPTSDFGDTALDAQKPTGTPANANEAYFHSGDMAILDPWVVNSGESIVIFVDGQLDIRNTIQVAQGAFLAFIVKEDIVIDPSVGNPSETDNTTDVEGMYVANGQIRLPSRGLAAGGDLKFVGAGTFVGWSGIVMERDYDDGGSRRLLNNTNPTELFIYRPDLALRTPTRMRAPRYQWREVAP